MDQLPPDYFTSTDAFTPHVYRNQYPSIDPTSAALSQEGKVVIITGASSGIGARAFAPAFAKANPRAIVLVGRNKAKLEETADAVKRINGNVKVLVSATEMTDPTSVDAMYAEIKSNIGTATVLVNNAGTFASQGTIADSNPADWWKDFEANVHGTYLITRGFLNQLGGETKGFVVNMSTGIASMVQPGLSSYSISKRAVLGLTEYIAAENLNVTAVTLQPGIVDTDMVIKSFKRFALDTPELVGGIGVWLATENAAFLSGRFISANWSVDDLMKQKEQIVESKDLKLVYQGKFGLDQFQ